MLRFCIFCFDEVEEVMNTGIGVTGGALALIGAHVAGWFVEFGGYCFGFRGSERGLLERLRRGTEGWFRLGKGSVWVDVVRDWEPEHLGSVAAEFFESDLEGFEARSTRVSIVALLGEFGVARDADEPAVSWGMIVRSVGVIEVSVF